MFATLLLVSGTCYVAVTAYQNFNQKVNQWPLPPFMPGRRAKQQASLSPQPPATQTTQGEQKTLVVAAAALLLATAGTLFSPLLSVAVVPALLYLTVPAIRQSYRALVRNSRNVIER